MNRNTERNESRLIKISHSPVLCTQNWNESISLLHQYLRGIEGRVSMRGTEFTALMLHQCAAVVAVNLQIDQTAEPKGSEALS